MFIQGGRIGVLAEEREVLEDYFELARVHVILDEDGERRLYGYLGDTAYLDGLAEGALVIRPVRHHDRGIFLADIRVVRPYLHVFDIDGRLLGAAGYDWLFLPVHEYCARD